MKKSTSVHCVGGVIRSPTQVGILARVLVINSLKSRLMSRDRLTLLQLYCLLVTKFKFSVITDSNLGGVLYTVQVHNWPVCKIVGNAMVGFARVEYSNLE